MTYKSDNYNQRNDKRVKYKNKDVDKIFSKRCMK